MDKELIKNLEKATMDAIEDKYGEEIVIIERRCQKASHDGIFSLDIKHKDSELSRVIDDYCDVDEDLMIYLTKIGFVIEMGYDYFTLRWN
ncbi:UNVERIFIED_ORG: hypothetical protein B2H93_04445 [Clostridium botulinum]